MNYTFELHDAATGELLERTPDLWEEIYKEVGEEYHLPEFSISIIYSYTKVIDPVFDQVLDSMNLHPFGYTYAKWLNRNNAGYTIPILEKIIELLSDQVDPDVFHATEGNAKKLLKILLVMAKLKPDAVWYVW